MTFHEDNQALIAVMQTGRNPTMRHLGRVHRVAIAWMHEIFGHECIDLVYTHSSEMAADVFTKAFVSKEKWIELCG